MTKLKDEAIKELNEIEEETIKDVEKRTQGFVEGMNELIKMFQIAIYPVNAVNDQGEVELGIKFRDLKKYDQTK